MFKTLRSGYCTRFQRDIENYTTSGDIHSLIRRRLLLHVWMYRRRWCCWRRSRWWCQVCANCFTIYSCSYI